MPACKFFAMGRCAFGENCTNSHDQPTTTQSNHIALPPPVQMMEPAYPGQKGITCWYFGSGYCRSGDTCPYKHDVAQLGAMSNLAILHADSAFVHQPKPVCRFYASGFCKNGDSCQLEHCADGPIPSDAEPGPERRIPAGPTAAAPQRSQRASAEQACAKQDSAQSGLAQYSKIPCRYFARGSCNKGFYCRFEHVLEPGLSSEVPHSPYINRNARNVSLRHTPISSPYLTNDRFSEARFPAPSLKLTISMAL